MNDFLTEISKKHSHKVEIIVDYGLGHPNIIVFTLVDRKTKQHIDSKAFKYPIKIEEISKKLDEMILSYISQEEKRQWGSLNSLVEDAPQIDSKDF